MRRVWIPLMFILGLILIVVGMWMSFELYARKKLSKVNENMAQILYELQAGNNRIRLKNLEENLVVIWLKDGKLITTANFTKPVDFNGYVSGYYEGTLGRVYTYTKDPNLGDYLIAIYENPAYLGLTAAGLVLFLLATLLMIRGSELTPAPAQEDVKNKVIDQEFIKRLKALRLTIATAGIIPKESSEEAKKILDDIIKEMEGKP
jgi:hypothetical protein